MRGGRGDVCVQRLAVACFLEGGGDKRQLPAFLMSKGCWQLYVSQRKRGRRVGLVLSLRLALSTPGILEKRN